ncbi:MAG: class III poly(R)-hydroxyalkanoic acid synthase subunit PhaE [Lysobacteraceae bacterium]|nr:MAG: class III poly(R)-hydroxyalkanoic acid synthase subunit PhaE [Xanthomonadaceae bacterium]
MRSRTMWTAKGGSGMGDPGFGMAGDAGAIAQRYWQAWSDALRSVGTGAAPGGGDVWQAAVDGWTRMAGGGRSGGDGLGDTVERFAAQARHWFGAMQDVAGRFAGKSATAGDIVEAWKQAMGASADNPFAGLFSGMAGRGQSGFDQGFGQASPLFGAISGASFGPSAFAGLRQDGQNWLRMPAFGLAREHQERWQALISAQLELQQKNDEYNALMFEAGRDAFERFERKLAERSEPGRQLQSARALFDLWIDAAEEAYAEIALSQRFRRLYGELVNAQMRVRAGIQREIENVCALFGMPTRTEVDATHRKVAELERQLRRMRQTSAPSAPTGKPTAPNAKTPKAETPKEKAPKEKAPKEKAPKEKAPKPDAPKTAAAAGQASVRQASVRQASVRQAAAKKTSVKTPAKTPSATPKPVRAVAKSAARRASSPIAIAMPEPLKPMPAQARTSAKRKR